MNHTKVQLTQGYSAIIDPEDWDKVSAMKWHCHIKSNTIYAMRTEFRECGKKYHLMMHRFIINAPDGVNVDHINRNGLDNRKSNLRLCNPHQNMGNRKGLSNSSSIYKGVHYKKRDKCWYAKIKREYIGCFRNEIEAAMAYDLRSFEIYGEFAYLNFPTESGYQVL